MAYTFRAAGAGAGNASGSALTVNMPAGVTTGDLLIIVAYLEADTNTWTAAPSGYTLVQGGANTGGFNVNMWYKIAGASESSATLTPTTGGVWRTAFSACWSGGSGSGSFVDVVSAVSQGDAITPVTNQTAATVTTTANDDLLVFCYGNFSGTNVTTLTGTASTLAQSFGGLTVGYVNRPTLGATGTTAPNAGPGSDDYAAFHATFLLTGAGGGGGGSVKQMTTLGVG